MSQSGTNPAAFRGPRRWALNGKCRRYAMPFHNGTHTIEEPLVPRECLPLAASGLAIRYVSPMNSAQTPRVTFISTRATRRAASRQFPSAPSLLRELLRQNASIYHFQDPELLPTGFLLKLIFRKRVIYDAYEDFPSMTANKRSIPRFLRLLLQVINSIAEHLAAHCLDGLMTADPFTLHRLARVGRSKKLVFYNFPNLDFFPPPSHQTPKRFDIVYRGGISDRAGTFVLLEAMSLLANPAAQASAFCFSAILTTRSRAAIRDRIRTLGLESCVKSADESTTSPWRRPYPSAYRRVPAGGYAKVRSEYSGESLRILGLRTTCGGNRFAANSPVFYGRGHAGFLFQPGNAADLAQSIAWLLDHPVGATRMGANGRASWLSDSIIRMKFTNYRTFAYRLPERKHARQPENEQQMLEPLLRANLPACRRSMIGSPPPRAIY